ncbi:MAG: ATP-binding protein [Solirubrobacterales bacterium]
MPATTKAPQEMISLELPAVPEAVPAARHAVADFARYHEADVAGINMAVSEAVGNAVRHAFLRRDPGSIWVRAGRIDDAIVVVVEDDGSGVEPRIDSPGLGLGIPIIESVCETLTIERREGGGARVVMRFALVGAPSPAG